MTKTIQIGHSGIQTQKLGLGTNKVGGHNLFPNLKDADGAAVVRQALDAGITLLDTAFAYGKGRSEEIIGEVLKNYDRSKVLLATKAAHDPQQNMEFNNTPAFLTKSVDSALQRLQTDYLDIFYIHFPDKTTPKAEAIAALSQLKAAGKIRAIGVSNFSLAQIKEANVNGDIDIVEDNYSLVNRGAEQELFPYLREQQITFVPYFPLASGLLTGKYTVTDAHQFTKFTPEQFTAIITAVDAVKEVADAHGTGVAQVILAWYIANENIGVVIPGARVPEQVLSNVEALNVQLTADEFKQIDQLFAPRKFD